MVNNNEYQGPVPEGFSEEKFRRTGKTKKKFSTRVKELQERTKIIRATISKNIQKKRFNKVLSKRLRDFARIQKIKKSQLPTQKIVQGGKVYTPDGRVNIPATIDLRRKQRNERKEHDRNMHNLMKAHHQMADVRMDFLEEKGTILHAENLFAAERQSNIMRTNRPNILQTREAGNSLF